MNDKTVIFPIAYTPIKGLEKTCERLCEGIRQEFIERLEQLREEIETSKTLVEECGARGEFREVYGKNVSLAIEGLNDCILTNSGHCHKLVSHGTAPANTEDFQ